MGLQKPTLAIDNEVPERVLYVLLRLAVLFWWGVRRATMPRRDDPANQGETYGSGYERRSSP